MGTRTVDLSTYSSRGITSRDRALAVGVTFFIPVLFGITIPWMFLSQGVNAGTGIIATILGAVGVFNLGLGVYALRVTRAPGAKQLQWDEEALRLGFPGGREDVYRWTDGSMRFSLYLLIGPESPDKPWTFLRCFWRPPSMIPRALAQELLDFSRSRGITVTTKQETLRFYGPATVYEIHGTKTRPAC